MKNASAGLIAFLAANNKFQIADLYKITLQDGTIYNWTTGDTDMLGYSSIGPVISRGRIRTVAGIETGTLEVTLGVSPDAVEEVADLAWSAMDGAFDGATVEVDRIYMPTWGDTSLGTVRIFAGRVAGVQPSGTAIVLTVKSGMEQLSAKFPRRVFQPQCPKALYSVACGVTPVPISATVTDGTNPSVIYTSIGDVTFPVDHLALGTLRVLDGRYVGITRPILSNTEGTGDEVIITLAVPMPGDISGSTAEVLIGCDKSFSGAKGCGPRFANADRFGGFPWVPKPESVR